MFRRREYKITEVEFDKLKEEFRALQNENAHLKARNDFHNLLQEINELTNKSKALKLENESLKKENASLTNTLCNERHTASLVLKKLNDVVNTCDNVINKSTYIKAIDILC